MYRSALLVFAIFTLAACQQESDSGSSQAAEMAQITGTVTYRERIALTPEAELELSLLDISRQDVKATVIATSTISNPGQVPIKFVLEYDPARIDERMSYSVSARITAGGKTLFHSDTQAPVLTRGSGTHVDIMVSGMRSPGFGGRAAASRPRPQVAEKPAGIELEGMFRYMADAALFRDCRNNKSYPVSMEGAYAELESAYLNSGVKGGSEIGVKLTGRFLERPGMEINTSKVKLIIDSFDKLLPEISCVPQAHAELLGTYWKLLELGGQKVRTPDGAKEAHIILAAEDSRAHGNAGCNNFFTTFESQDDKLTFSAAGSTMMACPAGMDTEAAFLKMLDHVTTYRISGLVLELHGDDQILARLEATYL